MNARRPAPGTRGTRLGRRVASAVALGVLAPVGLVAGGIAGAAVPASAAPAGCLDRTVRATVEQARLTREAPQQILVRSTADAQVTRFTRELCRTDRAREARPVVRAAGRELWRWATERAQGEREVRGSIPPGDDRPLYWARVAMTRVLAQWGATHDVGVGGLLDRLETTSRGQDTLGDPGRRGARGGDARVVVTGFDPFTLDVDDRIGNPSGAVALALDGRRLRTADGWVRVETAVFPVRWDDFAAGEVERTLSPYVRRGPRALRALVTVSQGRPEQFDLEVWNGANRGGFADNANRERTGLVPIPRGYPTVRPQPQFTRTDLPVGRMARQDTGRYTVVVNPEITERDPETGEERTTRSGPTPGFLAVAGSPGDYLSNEIAYRATLLRDAKRAGNVGGHVHTPVLGLPRAGGVTDPSYVDRRRAIVRQTVALVRAAVAPGR